MSVFANQAGSSATFYLAKVDSVYLGKKLNVQLFDPGEGAKTIEILDPQGNPVNFSYSTVDDNTGKPDSAFTKGFLPYSGTGTSLDLQGTITPPPGFASFYKFSDRHLLLQTTISKSGWYKIRYTTNAGGVTDRTTWSVTVLANPVHLVPNG